MLKNQIRTPGLAATALGGLIAGTVAGATIAAVKNAGKVKKGSITKKEAMTNVACEAGAMGLASTIGLTATALLGITGVVSIASVALITSGSKCAIDSLLNAKFCEIEQENKTEKLALEESSEKA